MNRESIKRVQAKRLGSERRFLKVRGVQVTDLKFNFSFKTFSRLVHLIVRLTKVFLSDFFASKLKSSSSSCLPKFGNAMKDALFSFRVSSLATTLWQREFVRVASFAKYLLLMIKKCFI